MKRWPVRKVIYSPFPVENNAPSKRGAENAKSVRTVMRFDVNIKINVLMVTYLVNLVK